MDSDNKMLIVAVSQQISIQLRLVLGALKFTMFPIDIEAIGLVLRMLTVAMSQKILRPVFTGIENTNSCYVTINIVAIGTVIEKVNSCYVTVDIEAY